ncbi:MAG: hypothetical protein ACLP22_23010 [Solirubrobacteraceae bacterium]
MTRSEIDAALAAANPLTSRTAAALPLCEAETELIERIAAMPVDPGPSRSRPVSRRRRFALVLVAAAAVAVALALLPSGDGSGGPTPAFAAALVRFANASPLALLQLPDWHVVYADEEPDGFGEMHFVRGAAGAGGTPRGASFGNEDSLAGRVASLTWYPVTKGARTYLDGGHQTAATGLGVTARRFVGEGRGRGWVDVSAFLILHGRELTFRATVTDMEMFYAELRALNAVDVTTWLRAMPPSVVKTADSTTTIRLMLKGIPLPPGFDAARIRGAGLVHDRYQLGAAVTGTIACMWISDWSRARAAGDTAMVTRALAAMATALRWAILHQMATRGAWAQVLIMFAHAMPHGTLFGRPLDAAANSGLGCSEWGVHLPGTSALGPLRPRAVPHRVRDGS